MQRLYVGSFLYEMSLLPGYEPLFDDEEGDDKSIKKLQSDARLSAAADMRCLCEVV